MTTSNPLPPPSGAESPDIPRVPWIDPTIQQRVGWRDGDIVISVPPKSGTTWTMNIVHQLRSGGDPDLFDIYAEVPWLEIVPRPGSTAEELVRAFDEMGDDRRRAFKSHSAPDMLPYHEPGTGPDVRYVVVVRNPDEAVASFRPFIEAHSDAWFDMWQMPKEAVVRPDFATFFAEIAGPGIVDGLFGFVASWWRLRQSPNVLLVHFSDMKRDHEGSVRQIAGFLGFEPDATAWPSILEYTSFDWMKANEEKFELRSVSDVPVLEPGGMMRRGQIGASADDGVTAEIAQLIAAAGRAIVDDESALDWCYNGGPVPD